MTRNKERKRQYDRDYRSRNRDHISIQRKQFYQDNRERILEWHRGYGRARKYGLTDEAFDFLIDRAAGRCECCGVAFSGKFFVEHDHSTGRVRGLVCARCNIAIGVVEDSVLFENAKNWVKRDS